MHPNPVVRHMEDSLIDQRHVAAYTFVPGVNRADGGPLLRRTGMAAQADLDRHTLRVRMRRIAMCVVAACASDRLAALDVTFRLAQRGDLTRDQQLVRKGIGPIGESRVTLSAYFETLLARQLLWIEHGIEHARMRFALADRLNMLDTRAMAALASHAALLARSESTGLTVTRKTLHFKTGAD